MEPLMNSIKKVLFIVEGEYTEKAVLKQIEAVYNLDFTICCFKANIYALYKKLTELEFNADIKQVLAEMHPSYSIDLADKFVYTYLIFDFDAHHPKKEDKRTLKEIITSNVRKLQKMAEYFTDETDPTIGKLYINYPMVESFRACNMPFDPNYQNEYVMLQAIKDFKDYTGSKKMAQKRIDTYSRYDFKELTKMNIYKLAYITLNNWGGLTYQQYLNHSSASEILNNQINFIEQSNQIAVLNTMLFILTDYYGNQKNRFFDFVMR